MDIAKSLILRAGCLSIVFSAILSGCGSPKEPQNARALPDVIKLHATHQVIFSPEGWLPGATCSYVSGPEGQVWEIVLGHDFDKLVAHRILLDGSDRRNEELISLPDWEVYDFIVGNDAKGDPTVAMRAIVPSGRGLFVQQYVEGKWTDPVELDGLDFIGDLAVLLDSQGRLHVIYEEKLSPAEDYGVSFHGAYADKSFHAFMENGNWTKGAPMTGRGRFNVRELALQELSNGIVRASMEVWSFSHIEFYPKYIGYQDWNGSEWSKLRKATDAELAAAKMGTPDYWGHHISWRTSETGETECVVLKEGESTPIATAKILSEPVIVSDRDGRIFVCSWDESEAELRLWNGDGWGDSVRFPTGDVFDKAEILCNPDGNIYIVLKNVTKGLIQRIETADSNGEAQESNTSPHASTRDLVFMGTVDSIQAAPLVHSRANWVVTFRVEKVETGEFDGSTFSFRIHSPSMDGLEVGKKFIVEATRTDTGYIVDQYQASTGGHIFTPP